MYRIACMGAPFPFVSGGFESPSCQHWSTASRSMSKQGKWSSRSQVDKDAACIVNWYAKQQDAGPKVTELEWSLLKGDSGSIFKAKQRLICVPNSLYQRFVVYIGISNSCSPKISIQIHAICFDRSLDSKGLEPSYMYSSWQSSSMVKSTPPMLLGCLLCKQLCKYRCLTN